jgi:hypothetical protein
VSSGRMHIHSARSISDNGVLVGDEGSLPASPLSVGQATVIFFI